MDANKTKAFSEGGGETGSMYVLSFEVRWYVHIIYNQWYVHVPRSVQSVWYVNIPRSGCSGTFTRRALTPSLYSLILLVLLKRKHLTKTIKHKKNPMKFFLFRLTMGISVVT